MQNELCDLKQRTGMHFTEFGIMIDGKNVHFSLAIVSEKNWREREQFGFAYVSDDDQLMATSCYSGGATGGGVNDHSIYKVADLEKKNGLKIVTKDLDTIIQMGLEATEKREAQRKAYQEAVHKACELINTEMPQTRVFFEDGDKCYYLSRDEAKYEPTRSSRYLPEVCVRVGKSDSLNEKTDPYIWVDEYIMRRTGNFQKTKARRDFGQRGPEIIMMAKAAKEMFFAEMEHIANRCNVRKLNPDLL